MAFQIVKLIDPPIDLSVNVSPQGAYDNSTSYTIGQSVSYNGSSFVAKQTTVGNLPTDTTYWQVLASKGDVGATGPTGATGSAGADGVVQSIVAGDNITVDNTDPANPVVTGSAGGGLNVGLAIAVQNGIINL